MIKRILNGGNTLLSRTFCRPGGRWQRSAGLLILALAAAYGAWCLWAPPTASGQTGQPTREYIYLDGKAVAVEE